jgi:hypothetical protein
MKIFVNTISYIKSIISKIGSSNQFWGSNNTVLGYANVTYKHIHNPGLCYPNNGSVISVITSDTAGQFGSFVDAIPINTFDRAFDLHWCSIANISAVGDYILQFHTLDSNGDSLGIIGEVDCHRTDNFTRVGPSYLQIPIQPPNTRIGVRALKGNAGAGTVSFVLNYHDYV